MSIFRKIEMAFIGLLLAALAGLTVYSYIQKEQLAAAKKESSLQTGRADAHEVAAVEYTRIITDKDTANAELDRALEANPAYSRTAVPPDVADLLRHPSGAARAVPQ